MDDPIIWDIERQLQIAGVRKVGEISALIHEALQKNQSVVCGKVMDIGTIVDLSIEGKKVFDNLPVVSQKNRV